MGAERADLASAKVQPRPPRPPTRRPWTTSTNLRQEGEIRAMRVHLQRPPTSSQWLGDDNQKTLVQSAFMLTTVQPPTSALSSTCSAHVL
jgi:hypothetical protein